MDIGLHEHARPVDGTVHMAFRRKMHDGIRLVGLEQVLHGRGIKDAGRHVAVAAAGRNLRHGFGRRRIGHAVDIDDTVVRRVDQVPYHGGTDKSAATSQQYFHHVSILMQRPFREPDTMFGMDNKRQLSNRTGTAATAPSIRMVPWLQYAIAWVATWPVSFGLLPSGAIPA